MSLHIKTDGESQEGKKEEKEVKKMKSFEVVITFPLILFPALRRHD